MKLQFKEQAFQVQAVAAVVDCFAGQPNTSAHAFDRKRSAELMRKAQQSASTDGVQGELEVLENIGYRNSPLLLSEMQVLTNIQAIQQRNDLHRSPKIERPIGTKTGYNLTIDMETGTGKTYTYIRTMYELHKHYGWSKFIIIVPSIAIREGVYKSFQVTETHFQERYGHKIAPFIYNSAKPQDIASFASDSRISVMIINTQAFNASGADARRIHQELDQFGTQRPIDIIAQTNPIIIIDEPQSVDGEKTLKSMQDFNPLFTLRYSATHKVDYNKVFRLDALDAYNQYLVKKIQVKGINLKGSTGTSGYVYLEQISVSVSKPPYAIVEFEKRVGEGVKRVRQRLEEKANLYELSGNLPAYENCIITEINGQYNRIVLNGQEIYAGDMVGEYDEQAFRQIQIRETLQAHFQKEKSLFEQGIKVLSLFFIDTVEKYRVYSENGEAELGEYARMFEEEYHALLEAHPEWRIADADLPTADFYTAGRVHQGYFSIDKKGRAVNPATKRNSEDSDDISAYDLIMKDKERLLSFAEPTRFIFSHSALREGWDNPNVFQICALKTAVSGSQTRRRQEVGRGMRLCVNAHGIRQDYDTIGDLVHEVNKLTIVASESYETFAKGLQSEITATLKDRPQKANANYFVGKMVQDANGTAHRLTDEEGNKLNKWFYKQELVDDDDMLTQAGVQAIAQNTLPELPERFAPYRESLIKLLRALYTGETFQPEDARKTITLSLNKNFDKAEFQALWQKISLKTVYEVQFDTAKLIADSIQRIDEQLFIGNLMYEIKTGELEKGSLAEMKMQNMVRETSSEQVAVKNMAETQTVYDVIGELETHTQLLRRTLVTILQGISSAKFALLRKNPEAFIAKCARFINEVKASLILNNIVYHKIDAQYNAKTIFTNDKTVLRNADLLKKHIYDHLQTDSGIEKKLLQDLENAPEVIVYAKLPRSFYISTPIAKYSPDWAIVINKEKERHVYFVAESKGSDSDMDLREIEKLKLHCADKHFAAISDGEVQFKRIKSYGSLLEILQ